jgi:penicillin-binding protein 2
MVWQQENRLNYEDFLGRYHVVVMVLFGFFLLLSLRLFYLQVVRGGYLRQLSEEQRTQVVPERAPRGIIYDRHGTAIAGNKTSFAALFYPFSSGKTPTSDVIAQLKIILHKDLGMQITRGWRSGQAVRLVDDLSREEMFLLQEKRLLLSGISVVKEARREYAAATANAHLVGYLNEIKPDELTALKEEGYKSGELMGRGGLEQTYNGLLRGQDGGWQIEVDAWGHQTRVVRHIAPKIGNSLYTTIDARLQEVAATALAESPTGRGAAVALDPRSGAVRLLVSTPGYDPRDALNRGFGRYLQDKKLPLYNRVVQALYPPGSTFKIVTVTGALADAKIDPALSYTCGGNFTLGNKTFGCWYKKGHGRLSLIPALANSCNVYFYQLGLKVGNRALEKYARAYHLGEKTGIDIPSEKKGLVPSPEWKLKKMRDVWQQGDTVNIAIGQGPLWVTPLQMAALISGVATRGIFYQPYIVDRIASPQGEPVFTAEPRRKPGLQLESRTWDLLQQGLVEAVQNGTGRGGYFSQFKVAGKTGTAQNPHGNDHAWFVSYAPADNPELAVAVIVENGGHGGTAAVPVVRRIYETYFNIYRSTTAAAGQIGAAAAPVSSGTPHAVAAPVVAGQGQGTHVH